MSTITILGAGAMGSAMATPLRAAGHDVRLWGTHLDDHLIAAARAGEPHPRTGVPVAQGTRTFLVGELAEAMAGADVVVLAVASVGVVDIIRLAAPHLAGVRGLLLTAKGFAPDAEGAIQLLPQAVLETLAAAGIEGLPLVAVGGPCKANEVAAGQPTATIFAAAEGVDEWAALAHGPVYRVARSTDIDGVEICAALKNVYAIALGVADGLGEVGPQPFHNLKSAIFATAIAELGLLLDAEGADPRTAVGLAGVGDLEVTGLSGRNKVYGTRLGRGQTADVALAEMVALEQTVEGVAAVPFAVTFVEQRHPELLPRLPLLQAVNQVVHHGADIDILTEAALPR